MKSKIIFPGSFDMLHQGHLDFYKFLLLEYDAYLVISNNPNKNNSNFQSRYENAKKLFNTHNLNPSKIIINFGLTINICELLNINLIARSYLNMHDYKYELKLSKQYKSNLIPIRTILFKWNKNKNIRSSLLKKYK